MSRLLNGKIEDYETPNYSNVSAFEKMLKKDLGKLESTHAISPVYLQRAAVVAVVSFLFFLAMLVAFSIRQNVGYFLLATAFLVVEVFTMIGWFSQRRTEVKIFENGFTFKKQICGWNEIESVSLGTVGQKRKCEIKKSDGETIALTEMIEGIEQVIKRIEAEIGNKLPQKSKDNLVANGDEQ